MRLSDVAARLSAGECVEFRPSGRSMEPLVKHRELVRLEPIGERPPERGEVVLAKVHGRYLLHLIGAVSGDRYRIENRRGRVNGWVTRGHIYGRLGRDPDRANP